MTPAGPEPASPHELLNPPELGPPVGFSHVVVPAPGRLVYVAGQASQLEDGSIAGDSVAEQFELAVGNLVTALEAAGAAPEHLVSLQIFVTSVEEYRVTLGRVGEAWRARFGHHYPAIALLGVSELFDAAAKVELVGVAVVPDS